MNEFYRLLLEFGYEKSEENEWICHPSDLYSVAVYEPQEKEPFYAILFMEEGKPIVEERFFEAREVADYLFGYSGDGDLYNIIGGPMW